MLFSRFFALSSLLATACAAPFAAHVAKRDVVDPKILSPSASTVWVIGATETVTWDTSDLPPPANITNTQGMVVLGQFTSDGGEHLDIDNPLAQGFSILSGSVNIVVPKVTPGDYMIVLFGDSGNNSPQFRIVASESASVGPTSSSLSLTSTPASQTSISDSSPIVNPPTSASSSPTSPVSHATPSNPLSLPPSSSTPSSEASSTSSTTSAPSSESTSVSLGTPPLSVNGTSSVPSAPPPSPSPTTNGASSWAQVNGCLTLAAVALSVLLMI